MLGQICAVGKSCIATANRKITGLSQGRRFQHHRAGERTHGGIIDEFKARGIKRPVSRWAHGHGLIAACKSESEAGSLIAELSRGTSLGLSQIGRALHRRDAPAAVETCSCIDHQNPINATGCHHLLQIPDLEALKGDNEGAGSHGHRGYVSRRDGSPFSSIK